VATDTSLSVLLMQKPAIPLYAVHDSFFTKLFCIFTAASQLFESLLSILGHTEVACIFTKLLNRAMVDCQC